MKLQKTVVVDKPLYAVFGYLSDFTTTTGGTRIRSAGRTIGLGVDTMTFHTVDAGTEVTYHAEFTFKGPARFVAPLFKPALERLGQHAQAGLYRALNKL